MSPQPGETRTVTIPRCGKCTLGQHTRCEIPRHVEGSVATCCCARFEEKFIGTHFGQPVWTRAER